MGKFGVFYSIFLLLFFVLVLNLLWNMNFIIVVFHEIFIALCWSHKNVYKCIVLCPVSVVQAFYHGERGGRAICKVLKRFWKLQVIVKVICYTRWFAMTIYGAKKGWNNVVTNSINVALVSQCCVVLNIANHSP